MPQYMIGYGSLINKASRTNSAKSAEDAYPIWVKGYERGWMQPALITQLGINFLGVRAKPGAAFNGVYYLMNQADLKATDAREQGYCRVEVSSVQLKSLNGTLPKGQYWLYVTPDQKVKLPTKRYPIVQSYVDVVLTGCIHIGQAFQLPNFAKQCITTTQGWSKHWINDRLLPRRPWVYVPDALVIDELLKANISHEWKQMKLQR